MADTWFDQLLAPVSVPVDNAVVHGLGQYMVSPFAHPVVQALAGGGVPGQMEAAMAQAHLPIPQGTLDFLRRLGLSSGFRPGEGGGMADAAQFHTWMDYLDLPRMNLHPAGAQMAAGLYDRFLLPGVLQQMQADPYFGPALQQIMGSQGSAQPS